MSQSPAPKRSYSSTRRRVQAGQTRRLILEAARRLFYERGYASATIESIAQNAGVAQETVYAVFGSKQKILRSLVDVTLVGDEEPVPLLQRPFIQAAALETDQRRLVEKFARDIYQIMVRMSPLFALLRATAKTDPEIASLLAGLLRERLKGMAFFVNQLRRIGPVRGPAGVDSTPAVPSQVGPSTEGPVEASVWVLSSAEVFDLLTGELGWNEEQYVAWLSDSLARLLLP